MANDEPPQPTQGECKNCVHCGFPIEPDDFCGAFMNDDGTRTTKCTPPQPPAEDAPPMPFDGVTCPREGCSGLVVCTGEMNVCDAGCGWEQAAHRVGGANPGHPHVAAAKRRHEKGTTSELCRCRLCQVAPQPTAGVQAAAQAMCTLLVCKACGRDPYGCNQFEGWKRHAFEPDFDHIATTIQRCVDEAVRKERQRCIDIANKCAVACYEEGTACEEGDSVRVELLDSMGHGATRVAELLSRERDNG